MSEWTHVAGIIRYDDVHDTLKPEYEKALGHTWKLVGMDERHKKIPGATHYAPTGREGTIQWCIKSHTGTIAAHVVTIWGDLRDVNDDDVPKIIEWFRNCVEPQNFLVRQSTLVIKTSTTMTLLTYDEDENDEVVVTQRKLLTANNV